MSAGRTHTGPSPFGNKTVWEELVALIQVQQSKNDLPACVTISIKALCAVGAAFNHPFLYLLLRIHVCKCWYRCYHMTISVLFSLSPVKDPCLQVLIPLSLSGNIHFHFSISCSASMFAAFMDTHCQWTTSESMEIWPNSKRPITIMQNVSLRTAGCTHTGSSPLGNKTVGGQPAAFIIQVLARVNGTRSEMTQGRTRFGSKTIWIFSTGLCSYFISFFFLLIENKKNGHNECLFKEYLKLLNRLYDITWCGSVYA